MAWNVAYLLLLFFATPWLIWKRISTGKRRAGLWTRFTGRLPPREGDAPCVWVHAVSVGEVQVAATLIAALQVRSPELDIVATVSTQAGYELARRRLTTAIVHYAPLDFTWAIRRALRQIRPNRLILIELEIWPNWIRIAKSQGIQVVVVNARLSAKSFRGYLRWGRILRRTFSRLDLVAAQDTTYAGRFQRLGVPAERIHVTGSLKFDGAESDRDNPRTLELARIAGLRGDHFLWVVGSTQAPEESIALEVYQSLRNAHPELRMAIVPRHPERFQEVAELLAASGEAWDRWSRLATANLTGERPLAGVLLVDTVGDLRFWWGAARIAFVGGSLTRRGGQNMIEPAAYAAAVSFGPNTMNFRDIVEQLLAGEGAVVVQDREELRTFVDRCLTDLNYTAELGRRAAHVVQQHRGATERTLRLL